MQDLKDYSSLFYYEHFYKHSTDFNPTRIEGL